MQVSTIKLITTILCVFLALCYALNLIYSAFSIAGMEAPVSYFYLAEGFQIAVDIYAIVVYPLALCTYTKSQKHFRLTVMSFTALSIFSLVVAFLLSMLISSEFLRTLWINAIQSFLCSILNFGLASLISLNEDVLMINK